jgi:putative transposase
MDVAGDPSSKNNFRRSSYRLSGYHYAAIGAYFVTIVSHQRQGIFGNINDQVITLNHSGEIVKEFWQELTSHFHTIEIEPFIVMPNHIHGVITIVDGIRSKGTIYRAPMREKFGTPVVGSIPTIIRTYMAAVTRRSKHESGIKNIWQRNYYDHIICDEREYDKIWGYIESNPQNWQDRQDNLDAPFINNTINMNI